MSRLISNNLKLATFLTWFHRCHHPQRNGRPVVGARIASGDSIDPFDGISLCFLRSTSLNPSLLIPNLREFHWHMNTSHRTSFSIMFIRHLLAPSLVSLDLLLHNVDDATLQSFLANCPLLCPNLRFISINIDRLHQVSPIATAYLSQAISFYNHPEYLDISIPVNNVALVHIAKSATLKKLTLTLDPERSNLHGYQVHLTPGIVPFCNVKEMSLETCDLSLVTALLRTQDQMFHSLKVSLGSQPTIDALSAVFTVLSSSQHTDSRQSLSLEDNWISKQSLHVMNTNKLRPLTCLCHLRKLDINLGYWISISDDNLISLTRNWPLLESLTLSWEDVPGRAWMFIEYITFKGLLSLVRCCPNLQDIMLPLDARQVVKTVDTEWEEIVCNPDLTELCFTDSPIDSPQSVEEILDLHFPSVVEIGAWFSSSEEAEAMQQYEWLWSLVNTYLEDNR